MKVDFDLCVNRIFSLLLINMLLFHLVVGGKSLFNNLIRLYKIDLTSNLYLKAE